jgi:hypothetical protein
MLKFSLLMPHPRLGPALSDFVILESIANQHSGA